MHFLLDENVPTSLASTLNAAGHQASFVRQFLPAGSPDPLVATISEKLDAILISFDGDFEKIAPRIPKGTRRRFRRLSRIWMKCNEPQASSRMEKALSLIEFEFELAMQRADRRMLIWIANGYIRTER